jgi:hypothetical protein
MRAGPETPSGLLLLRTPCTGLGFAIIDAGQNLQLYGASFAIMVMSVDFAHTGCVIRNLGYLLARYA